MTNTRTIVAQLVGAADALDIKGLVAEAETLTRVAQFLADDISVNSGFGKEDELGDGPEENNEYGQAPLDPQALAAKLGQAMAAKIQRGALTDPLVDAQSCVDMALREQPQAAYAAQDLIADVAPFFEQAASLVGVHPTHALISQAKLLAQQSVQTYVG